MTELTPEQMGALLARGYHIISVKAKGKWHYIWPEPLEEKVFAVYAELIESSMPQEIEDKIRPACSAIVESWFHSWETWDDELCPCGE